MAMHYGLDIGGTKIELTIFDASLTMVSSMRIPTPTKDYKKFLDVISCSIKEADGRFGVQGTVGIGFPGVIDQDGRSVSANIDFINGQALSRDFEVILNRPIASVSDIRAFTLSEANGGAGTEYHGVLGVIVGTGLSAGLCHNGYLYRSKHSIAGELGHIPLPGILQQRYNLPLRYCGCGLTGCAEQYLSGPSLLWLSKHLGSDYEAVPSLIAEVREGEEKASAVFSAYLDCMGWYFAMLTLAYDPDVIVLGGGISNVPEIYDRLPEAASHYLFSGVCLPPVLAPTFGDSSGVRGAAILGHQLSIDSAGSS